MALEHSTQVVSGHPEGTCEGRRCPLHRRTDHHMRAFPQLWRDDAKIMERICPHGCGHPDPDDIGADHYVHGCDGCCRPPTTWQ